MAKAISVDINSLMFPVVIIDREITITKSTGEKVIYPGRKFLLVTSKEKDKIHGLLWIDTDDEDEGMLRFQLSLPAKGLEVIKLPLALLLGRMNLLVSENHSISEKLADLNLEFMLRHSPVANQITPIQSSVSE